jgi:hypothetical protein
MHGFVQDPGRIDILVEDLTTNSIEVVQGVEGKYILKDKNL